MTEEMMSLRVVARNDVRPDARFGAVSGARWVRLERAAGADSVRWSAQSVRRTRDRGDRARADGDGSDRRAGGAHLVGELVGALSRYPAVVVMRSGLGHGGRMMGAPDPHHRHRFPAAISSHAVWLYHAFTLSFRDVELLLAERGVILSYETVRRWCLKFAQRFANGLRHGGRDPGTNGILMRGTVNLLPEPREWGCWRAGADAIPQRRRRPRSRRPGLVRSDIERRGCSRDQDGRGC